MFGEFVYRFVEGDLKAVQNKFGSVYYKIIGGLMAGAFFMAVFTTMGYFRPFQPQNKYITHHKFP
jgi:hypothetical protein